MTQELEDLAPPISVQHSSGAPLSGVGGRVCQPRHAGDGEAHTPTVPPIAFDNVNLTI